MNAAEPQSMRCEVCGNTALLPALDLGAHPMCDDLVKIGDTRVCVEYPIEILYCDNCRTAHQRFQIPKRELFPWEYHYRSRHTADVLTGMKQLTEACGALCGDLAGKSVLDIGCNDGSLLSFFAASGAKTFGIEPTGASADARKNGHIVMDQFLDEAVAQSFVSDHGHPDLISFTNVFAHISDLPEVIRSLKILADDKTVIVIENHYLGAVIDRKQFDTFYHEHPRTYSFESFRVIAKSLDMELRHVEFPSRYGGNIRIFMSRRALPGQVASDWAAIEQSERGFAGGLVDLGKAVGRWRTNKLRQIEDAVRQHGPLRAKAFPGRSAIPVKLLGIGPQHISAVYEKPTSDKVGHYVPGTRIPILSDDEFEIGTDNRPVINLAWHISKEIHSYMRGRGFDGPLIDIIAPEDFA